MNILFMTIGRMENIEEHTIYCDLLRCFRDHGHSVYTISPREKSTGLETEYKNENGVCMLHIQTGNITKTSNLIEKGISTISIESVFIKGIKKYFKDVKFDLILYSTPPVTFAKVIRFIKKRDDAKSYLMLKDIFPQNSIDLGILSKSGIKGIMYKYFRKKEKNLYTLSDKIGCTSQANIDYVRKHNHSILASKVEFCANSIDPLDLKITDDEKNKIRVKYNLPLDKKIFVYGGNLGRPQDVPFIISCLKACAHIENAFFLIAGSGTHRHYLERYVTEFKPNHVKLFGHIPKDEYDKMIACCDVGIIFLNYRFTVPNTPSRLLAYCQAHLPTISCVDNATDVGDICVENHFGWKCKSNNTHEFIEVITQAISSDCKKMGDRAFEYMVSTYSSDIAYQTIIASLNNKN